MSALLARWNALHAWVNGREGRVDCDAFNPGEPGGGDCQTDGHYMCEECREMSAEALELRESQ